LAIQVGRIERIADAPCLSFPRLRQEWIKDGESPPEEIGTGFKLCELEEPFERLGRGAVAKLQRCMIPDRASELVLRRVTTAGAPLRISGRVAILLFEQVRSRCVRGGEQQAVELDQSAEVLFSGLRNGSVRGRWQSRAVEDWNRG
jgi:hypothetical protein